MGICECGCGREFIDNSATQNRKYYDPVACYHANIRRQFVPVFIFCQCGCHQGFYTVSPKDRRIYYNKFQCRQNYLKKKYNLPSRKRCHTISKEEDKPFRSTICQRQGVCREVKGLTCANYGKCSDAEIDGGQWEHEKNGGKDCWEHPEASRRNVCGNSFGMAKSGILLGQY